MFKKKDPNSFTRYFKLYTGMPSPEAAPANQIGYLVADYQVANYEDVQANHAGSWQQTDLKRFILHCTQQVVLFNPSIQALSVFNSDFPYENYPAMLNTFLEAGPAKGVDGFTVQVLDYSPKTVNSKVQNSGSTGIAQGTSQSSSVSTTVGSSTSETNSYGTSVTLGASGIGDLFSPSASVTASYDHSSTSSTDQSASQGSDNSVNRNSDSSDSASMSIKDWGSYAFVNPYNQNPSWIFGQEYPWDVIMCRESNGTTNPNTSNPGASGQVGLILPQDMVNRLYDPQAKCLYPPSQLSMFGLNFIMKTAWLISIDPSQAGEVSDIKITHNINYFSASHSVSGDTPEVYLDKTATVLQSDDQAQNNNIVSNLNLDVMALGVLGQPNKPAIIGFASNKFDILPSANPFRIISSANTLLVEDSTSYVSYPPAAPFSVVNSALTATFTSTASSPLSVSAYFKVVDTINDYKLYLKHWISSGNGIVLTITINGDTENPITKYVTASEAEGGESNLLAISLRNQDFSSIDYHDYLQLGLNCVEITIAPNGTVTDNCVYQVRAMSVEKA